MARGHHTLVLGSPEPTRADTSRIRLSLTYLSSFALAAHVIAKAKGLAVLSVIKAGFLVTARGGSGIVLARLPDGSK